MRNISPGLEKGTREAASIKSILNKNISANKNFGLTIL
jgi:hypothetical protein